jgi:hypothetical protein
MLATPSLACHVPRAAHSSHCTCSRQLLLRQLVQLGWPAAQHLLLLLLAASNLMCNG